MIKQKIIRRKTKIYDEGEMGFHDYVEEKEDYNKFISRVTDEMNDIGAENVNYPSENIAIITYHADEALE